MSVPYYYDLFFGVLDTKSMVGVSYIVATGFSSFFIIPWLICKYILKIKLSDVGLVLPKLTFYNGILTLCALSLMLPFAFYFASQPSLHRWYSLSHLHLMPFIFIVVVLQPLYYFAEEFFFRGFLFLTTWRYIGWHSFWVTDVMFYYAHTNKPIPELLLSIPASVLLNYIALKSKSVYPAMFVHGSMGILLNVLVY